MNRDEMNRLWQDPRNWKGGRIVGWYYCSEDPRVIVPKRPLSLTRSLGWTINFAHRKAFWALFGSIMIASGPTLIVMALGGHQPFLLITVLGGSIISLIALSTYLSSHPI